MVWTRTTGEPRRLGTAVQDGQKTLLELHADSADLPGLSVVYRTSFAGQRVEWHGDSEEPLHPALKPLVPPIRNDNLQYLIAADRLGLRRETSDKEWRLLTAIGHGAIGHLDAFLSDGEASRWYDRDAPAAPVDLRTSDLVHLATQTLDSPLNPIPL